MIWVVLAAFSFTLLASMSALIDTVKFLESVAASVVTSVIYVMFIYGARQLGWTATILEWLSARP